MAAQGRLTEQRIILVVRSTRLDELKMRFNTEEQARFYIEHQGGDFIDYKDEDKTYKQVTGKAEELLRHMGRVQVLKREFLPNFIFGKDDLIIVAGQDGLVANTLKYCDRQKVIGVNPDPHRWDGVLLPFTIQDLAQIAAGAINNDCTVQKVTMARVALNNGLQLHAVNDFYIGHSSHVSARYRLTFADGSEEQSSSGIVVSTGLGSTGWFKSLITGAMAVSKGFYQADQVLHKDINFEWDADYLYYTVREPFVSRCSQANNVFGKISGDRKLILQSLMAENGVIFSDGIENDYLEFNSGTIAEISVADKVGNLVVQGK